MVARREARRRRDRLNENARALAKLDEALMASLMIRVSPALEEQGARATSNGVCGLVLRGGRVSERKVDGTEACEHLGD